MQTVWHPIRMGQMLSIISIFTLSEEKSSFLQGEDWSGTGWEVGVRITEAWHFPSSPVVNTSPSNAGHVGSIPGQGADSPHASWPKKTPKGKTEAIL